MLPGIPVNRFATFRDGLRYLGQIGWRKGTCETQKFSPRNSGGCGKAAGEVEDAPLLGSVQAVHLLDNFVL